MKINGSQIIIEVLLEQGVDTIFGYPGGSVLNIYDALYKNSDRITHVITAHEQGATHAADAYARVTGKVGVCLATSGPGATNTITGIANAYMDSIPMVAITGNVTQDLIGLDSFQEVYITGITLPITKHNFVVRNIEDLADIIREAFKIAQSGRPGPVLIDIPKDITSAVCEFENKPKVEVVKKAFYSENDVLTAAETISKAERPVVLFGGGVVLSNADKELQEFVDKADLPCVNTLMGVCALPSDKNQFGFVGMHGSVRASKAVSNADLVIAIGTRFSDRVATNKNNFAQNAKIIHIDIDRAEINKNIMSQETIVGDIKEILPKLTKAVAKGDRSEWRKTIENFPCGLKSNIANPNGLNPKDVIEAVCDCIGENGIMATDVGQHQMWAAQFAKNLKSRSFVTSGGLGTMGFGMGAAIGAQVAYPDRKVALITGDGSFHMNMNELCTAVSFNLPIIVVLMNNEVLGMVRQWQTYFYDRRFSQTELHRQTNYVKLAEAYGGKGFRVETIEELNSALEDAKKSKVPCVIDVKIDKEEKVLPFIPAGKTFDDIILS